MNEPKTQAKHNLIDDHFDLYNARRTKPSDTEKALEPHLNTISEEFDGKLFDYIYETQRDAYRAGFATAMQLAADCYSQCKKIVPENP